MSDSKPTAPMTLEEARDEVKKCDEEIQSIKAALRGIGNVDSSQANSLEVEFTKVRSLLVHVDVWMDVELHRLVDFDSIILGITGGG
jgi:hypothetical protein